MYIYHVYMYMNVRCNIFALRWNALIAKLMQTVIHWGEVLTSEPCFDASNHIIGAKC